jgi:phage-related protein
VRASYEGEQYRVFFYVDGGTLVLVHGESRQGTMVLVHGLHKKTQRTPAAAIALARKRMKEGT